MTDGLDRTAVLLLDAGSSRLKWAWWRDGRLDRSESSAGGGDAASAVGDIESPVSPGRVVLASVLEAAAQARLVEALNRRFGSDVEVAGVTDACCGVRNGYANPARLGVDRWLAMIAGYRSAGACIVVDCGTAVTIDVVDKAGRHLGGQILPGLGAMARCLIGSTRLTDAPAVSGALLGSDTAACIGAGIHHAVGALIDRVAAAWADDHGMPRVIITGGDAGDVARFVNTKTEIRSTLVLDGLAMWAGLTIKK